MLCLFILSFVFVNIDCIGRRPINTALHVYNPQIRATPIELKEILRDTRIKRANININGMFYHTRTGRAIFERNARLHRSINSDVTCTQSPIQVNVTLKGGIEAGYFRKLAQHVAMQLCIELCCEEKGCDVAFMSGKNCYGVQCFNGELCKALPAKKNVTEPVMISHVTFKGERVRNKVSNKLQCSEMKEHVGMTLRGGLKAGNFTDVGKVNDVKMCTKLCCVSEGCDVALSINQNCFLVSCFSPSLCEMVKSYSAEYKPVVSYVTRTHEALSSASTLQILETTDNQLVCKNSQIFHNTTLKGGYKAGNYTNFGKVTNMSACVRLCCGNKDCDAALMLENNCFAVACRDSDNCLPVHAKSSSSLAALNPRISYITSRSEEVFLNDTLPDGICHAGIISYDVSLKGGSNAGNFTPHGKVGNMELCIYKCCEIDGCSVAMMLKDTCFTVVCFSDELCEKKQTPTSSDFNPKIAYVFRDKNTSSNKKKLDSLYNGNIKKKQILAAQLHAITKTVTSPTSLWQSSYITTASHSSAGRNIIPSKMNNSSSANLYFPQAVNNSTLNKFLDSSSPTNQINVTGYLHSGREKIDFNPDLTKDFKEEKSTSYFDGGTNATASTKHFNSSDNDTNSVNHVDDDNAVITKHFKNRTLDSNSTASSNNSSNQNNSKYSPDIKLKNTTSDNNCIDANCSNFKSDSGKVSLNNITTQNESKQLNILHKQIENITKLKSTLISVDGDSSCTSSAVLTNVTLQKGLQSGRFKDRGKMEDINQCVKLCCLLDKCDLAFMLEKTCFSVECHNRQSCDAVPAKSSIYLPTICYVYVKSAPNIT